ncbi:MAG: ribosome maturation factor RimM [Nitrospirales bacterium]|nr:MAG: ribosome maturation factor RimM [Nitrospirales bacterium]
MQSTTDSITIGRVLKPFGVKGEVRIESLTDVPGRFENLPSVTLVSPTGQSLKTNVTQARLSGRSYLLKFSAFSSPEAVSAYQGALIQVSLESVPPSPAGQFYQYELIGLDVHDEHHRALGQVEEVLDLPQHLVFIVRQDSDEYLIPATRQVIKQIDLKGKSMTVAPVEQWGLSDAV